MGVRRAPHAEIHYRTPTALFQEFSPVRTHLPHLRDESLPRLLKIAFLEFVDAIRVPERLAKPKKALITDIEIIIACPAMKKMIAARG
jgi:hypothetical protein